MTIRVYDLAGQEDDCRFSPHCWRVRMALAHKGLGHETVAWRFTEKDAIAFSAQGQVPVLVDGDTTVSDSWRIADYLEETYPNKPALFEGPQARAHGLFVKNWTERALHPAIIRVIILDLFAQLHEKDKAYFRKSREQRFGTTLEAFAGDQAQNVAALRQVIAPLRETVGQQPYLGGDGPSFADFIVFGAFQWARAVSPAQLLAADDPVHAWRGRLLQAYDGLAGTAKGFPV